MNNKKCLYKAIGGYFELELPSSKKFLYPDAIRYQSARVAFSEFLKKVRPNKIWMPNYICDSMLQIPKYLNINISFYSIDSQFKIINEINLKSNELLLYVNYFGICDNQINELCSHFCLENLVIDSSQAFYFKAKDNLATIYSPRKFFGIPDGGLIISKYPLAPPLEQDEESINRIKHLLIRLGKNPEQGYKDYQRAENSLKKIKPKRMSSLTEALLFGVDTEKVRNIRNRNFKYLHSFLGNNNKLTIPHIINGPLCYPFWPVTKINREELINNRIYLPTYWPDVLNRLSHTDFEYSFSNELLPIPCDQRYNKLDLFKIITLLSESIHGILS